MRRSDRDRRERSLAGLLLTAVVALAYSIVSKLEGC